MPKICNEGEFVALIDENSSEKELQKKLSAKLQATIKAKMKELDCTIRAGCEKEQKCVFYFDEIALIRQGAASTTTLIIPKGPKMFVGIKVVEYGCKCG